jgi:hypothetical protein
MRAVTRPGRGRRTWSVAPRTVPGRCVRATVALVILLPQLTGCFSYLPVGHTAPPVGSDVAFGVTDRGRVSLANTVGPGARRLTGRVVEATDSTLLLSVNTVEFIDLGIPVRWAGETVQIEREHIVEIRERRFSRTRTVIAMGIVAIGIVATTLIGLNAFGGETATERPDQPREDD